MAVVPVLPAAAPGVYSSSSLAQLLSVVAFKMKPPMARLRQATIQAITTATYTGVACDAEDYDSDVDSIGAHDNVTNNSRYTCRYPGWYLISGGISWASNATGRRGSRYAVNGSAYNASGVLINASAAVGLTYPTDANLVYLTVGDFVELQAFQDSGGSLNTVASNESAARFCVKWVSNA